MVFLRCSFGQDYTAYLSPSRLKIWLVFILMLSTGAIVLAANYNFTVVATDGDIIDGHVLVLDQQSSLSLPAINDSGEVIFTATFQGGRGIFSRTRAIVTEGDKVDGHVLKDISGNPDINSGGTVVYRASFSDGDDIFTGVGIFTESDLLFSTSQLVGDLEITAFPQSVLSINDNGNVAIMVRGTDVNTGMSVAHVIDRMGTIAVPGDILGEKIITEISQNPGAFVSINNADQVTFQATYDGKKGIFSRNNFLTGEGESVNGRVIDSIAAQTVITGTPKLEWEQFTL